MNNKVLVWLGIFIASWMLVLFIAKALIWAWHFAQTGLVIGVFAIATWLIWSYLAGRKSSNQN